MSIQNKSFRNYMDFTLIWGGLACMIVGFLINRVVSNCGFFLIGVYMVIYFNDRNKLSSYVWSITWLFMVVLPLLSDIVLEGLGFLNHRGVMKLLLLLFPLFIFTWNPNRRNVFWVNHLVVVSMFFSSIYSLYKFAIDYEKVISSYNFSKVMTVLSYGDHIRISWLVVISMILGAYEISKSKSKLHQVVLVVYCLFQVIFLHWLGAKTGLLMLYISIVVVGVFLFIINRSWFALLLIPIIALSPIVAYKTVPSFAQRINFIKYDWSFYSSGNYVEGLSDGVRFFSLKAGKELIEERPLLGQGFSQLQPRMNKWYEDNIPHMNPSNYFLPSSEIVIYWASGGILGLLAILSHILVPFFTLRLRKSIWFLAFFIPATFSFTFETHLEGLLPLWVYGFFAAWFWYIADNETDIEEALTTHSD